MDLIRTIMSPEALRRIRTTHDRYVRNCMHECGFLKFDGNSVGYRINGDRSREFAIGFVTGIAWEKGSE